MTNIVDKYAVRIYKPNDTLVGHLLGKLTTTSSLFLWHGGQISCQVTVRRHLSQVEKYTKIICPKIVLAMLAICSYMYRGSRHLF